MADPAEPAPAESRPEVMETSEPNSGDSNGVASAAEHARQLEQMNPTPLADKTSPPGGRGKRPGNAKGRDGKERISRRDEDLKKYTAVHTRPANVKEEKKGSGGDVVRLHSNYIEVKVNTKGVIHQYQVDFDPQPGTRPQRYGIMRRWGEAKQMPRESYTFDGGSVLYTGPNGAAIITEECEDAVQFNEQEMRVRMRRTANLDAENPQVLVMLNTMLNKFQEQELKMVRIQDNCYDPAGKLAPEGYANRLEIWPGFETSIGVFEHQKVLMSVDQRFRIIRNENAKDALREAFSSAQKTDGAAGAEAVQKKAAKALVGQTIETVYNHMVYKVQGIEWSKSPAKTFETRVRVGDKWEKKETSFGEYFATRYGVIIKDANQPLLVVKPANRALRRRGTEQILLVPELCRLTGYTDKIRADFRIMQAVSRHTKLDPARRKQATEVFIRKLAGNENIQKELRQWDITYGTELAKFCGRALRPQQLMQGPRNYSYDAVSADWTTGMRGAALQSPKQLPVWMVLCTQPNQGPAEQFAKTLVEVCGPMGMRLSQPKILTVADSAQAYIEAVSKNQHASLGLVLAVFSSNSKDRYDAFKETLCCNLPCASQVILAKTISGAPGKVKSVATKVAMQINAKLGGDIWTMNFPFTQPTMVIGIDCHRDRVNQKTLVAAAASWNKGFSLYYNCAVYADDDEQILLCIPQLVKECLEYFKNKNNVLPHGLYVYRDGISEGQLGNIKEIELAGVRNVTNGMSTDKKMTLTYILVNKRESTRFFRDENGQIGNPLSGTIVDDTVTRPWRYDFYIVSQSVREGTVAPTYYNVIEDDSALKPQHLQQMTYMLCHMYYNWPGTIRVPAPVQYARKHAQLIALNLHKKAADQLRERMFYL